MQFITTMNYTINDLNFAIYKNSYKMAKRFLSGINGNKIINNACPKKNLLNESIRSVLDNKNIDGFSLKIIRLLLENGAIPVNDNTENNTLYCAIICSKFCVKTILEPEKKLRAEKNCIKVIELLINNGAKPINCDSTFNTLSTIICTENLNIIRSIIKLIEEDNKFELKPDNCHDRNGNTLECALEINVRMNLRQDSEQNEILKLALTYGSLLSAYGSDNFINKLKIDPMIIQDCIIIGGKPLINSSVFQNALYKYTWCCDANVNTNINPELIDKNIELLMCSGGEISKYCFDWFKKTTKVNNRYMVEKMMDCYHLLTQEYHKFNILSEEYQRICDLKHRLGHRMRCLTDIVIMNGIERKSEIETGIIFMPTCCTDIIFGYQFDEQKFDTIDWSKY